MCKKFKDNIIMKYKPYDMTITELCKQSDISPPTLYRMFKDSKGTVSLAKYMAVANVLGVTLSDVFDGV